MDYSSTILVQKLTIASLLTIGILLTLLTFSGVTGIGVQNDESTHLSRLSNFLEHGWYLPTRFLEGGVPKGELDPGRLNSYGSTWSLVTHGINVSLGIETWGFPSKTSQAYEMRHFATVAIALLGAIALAFSLFIATRSALVGVATFTFLQATPIWTGYSMFAIKDTPVAAGYTLFTAGLIVLFFAPQRNYLILLSFSFVLSGAVLTVGVRTAMWLPLTLTTIGYIGLLFLLRKKVASPKVALLLIAILVATFIIFVTGAKHTEHFWSFLWQSVSYSTNFEAWRGVTLTAGTLMPENPGPWYLPLWVMSSVPLGILVIATVGLAATVFSILSLPIDIIRQKSVTKNRVMVPGMLLGLQLIGLPLAASSLDSVIYAGARQHLYTFSAIAGLAGVGIFQVMSRTRSKRITSLLLVFVLILPTHDSVSLHPYQFIYKNPLASPINDRWETDMHYVSAREALMYVPIGQEIYCYRERVKSDTIAGIRSCSGGSQIKPFIEEQGSKNDSKTLNQNSSFITIARKYGGSPPALGCEPTTNVERNLRGEKVILSYVLTCDSKIYDILE